MTAEDCGPGFKKYLNDIGGIPLITPAREIYLADRIKAGDQDARTLMIRSNLRLVVKIALGYTNLGLPLARPDRGGQNRVDGSHRPIRSRERREF